MANSKKPAAGQPKNGTPKREPKNTVIPRKEKKKAEPVKRGPGRPPKKKRKSSKPPRKPGGQPGNKNAEKFSEEYVIDLLNSMYRYATHSTESTNKQGQPYYNPVRANDIKLFKELCLCVGINSVQFSEIQEKFCRRFLNSVDNEHDTQTPNPNYSATVSEKVNTIRDICECRLTYSGQYVDTFVLKNHFGYTDKTDVTSLGEKLPAPVAPVITIIEQF